MRIVGIRELKDNLSRLVRAAAGGETVLISDRDRVVARLSPARSEPRAETRELHPVIADLVRRGLATAPSLPRGTRPGGLGLIPHERLMADLAADREDRR